MAPQDCDIHLGATLLQDFAEGHEINVSTWSISLVGENLRVQGIPDWETAWKLGDFAGRRHGLNSQIYDPREHDFELLIFAA
jgi:hypothetical protein